MVYGITNESQMIDIDTITKGINKYLEVIDAFEKSGKKVISASQICNTEALSIDDTTLQYPIESLGIEIKALKEKLNTIANELLYEAQRVRQQQYNELIEFQRQQALKQQEQNL